MKTVVALHTSCALLQRVIDLWAKYEIPAKLVNIIDDSLIWEVIDNDGATLSVNAGLQGCSPKIPAQPSPGGSIQTNQKVDPAGNPG